MIVQEEGMLKEDDVSSEKQMKVKLEIFNGIEVRLAIAVLEECIDKFAIIGAKLPKVDASFSMKSIKERAIHSFRGLNKEENIPSDDNDLILHKVKLSKELQQIQKVLTILKNDLKSKGSHTSLILFNYALRKILREESDLEIKHMRLNSSKERVISSYKELTRTFGSEITQLEKEEHKLREIKDELEFKIGSINLYFSHYEKARVEQNLTRIELTEKELTKKLDDTLKAIQDEKEANEQIVKYLERENKRLEESVKYWNKTYITDMEHRQLMLMKLETESMDQRHKMSSLLTEFLNREQEIKSYLAERAERYHLQQIEELKNQAATKIQAWWRGCMVRWELGEFSSDLGKRRKRKPKKK